MVSCHKIYEKTIKIMGELQPIAFLLSASLVISGLYTKDGSMQISNIYTLTASAFFFFAYIGLIAFRLTDFGWFFLLGIISLSIAFYFFFPAAIGIMLLASNLNDSLPSSQNLSLTILILSIIIALFIIVLTAFTVHKIKKGTFSKDSSLNKKIKSAFYGLYVLGIIIIIIKTETFSDLLVNTMGGFLGVDIISLLIMLAYISIFSDKLDFGPATK